MRLLKGRKQIAWVKPALILDGPDAGTQVPADQAIGPLVCANGRYPTHRDETAMNGAPGSSWLAAEQPEVAAPEEERRHAEDGEPDEDGGAVLLREDQEAEQGFGAVAVALDEGVVDARRR